MTRTLWFTAALMLTACLGGGSKDDADSADSGDPTASEACQLAEDHLACPECSDGIVTCSFGDVSATAASCGGCQAQAALYQALCEAGETADAATIQAGQVCGEPSCEVWFDGCTDPCTPLCVLADSIPDSTCDLGCTTPGVPPGECAWNGYDCAFVE